MDKIKQARVQLGLFIKNRREEMGQPLEIVAAFLGISANTLGRIEKGQFAWDIDTHHRILSALEIKPYFHALKGPGEEIYEPKAENDPERYHGFYIVENIILFPGQLGVLKLTDPRLFLRFNYKDALFSSFDEWKLNHTDIQFLDPADKPTDENEIESILIDCWNFLTLTEEEEDKLAIERSQDDD